MVQLRSGRKIAATPASAATEASSSATQTPSAATAASSSATQASSAHVIARRDQTNLSEKDRELLKDYDPSPQHKALLDTRNNTMKSWQWNDARGNPPDGVSDWDWADYYNRADSQIGVDHNKERGKKTNGKQSSKGTETVRKESRWKGDTRKEAIKKLIKAELLDPGYVDDASKH